MSKLAAQTKTTDNPLFMGIDAGTSGIRAYVIDSRATPVAEVTRPMPPPETSGNRVSQDPAIWATVFDSVLTEMAEKISLTNLKTIAIDGTSGTVLLTDDQGKPVAEALMYNDGRSHQQVNQLQTLTKNTVVQSVSAGLPKLMWLIEHLETNSSLPRHAMHQADWLGFLLTGQTHHSDVNNCLKTGYDPFENGWPDWLKQLPKLYPLLPEVHKPGRVVAFISGQTAKKYGMPVTTELVAGTTDSHAAILATGIQQPGEAVTSLGSTLVTKVISETPIFDERYGIYSQPYSQDKNGKTLWLVGGGSNSGGAVLRKYFSDEQMKTLSEQIDPEKDTGLEYYPLNSKGERFPVNDPDYPPRLSPRPDNDAEFFQGLLEGIARIEQRAYRLLADLGTPYPKTIYTVGGGSKNKVWARIRARYCQTAIKQSEYTEAAYGSALLARHGYQNKI
ncbi:MAG: FGGY-family carbohydrate kinase [Thioalkalispiraceae bacterium]